MDILEKLAKLSRKRVEQAKEILPEEELIKNAQKKLGEKNRFKNALSKNELSFICELKKASPSKGLIVEDFDYPALLKDYISGGADAISCLTEPEYFMGSLEILRDVASQTELPVLRKDFIVDSYQIYEALNAGASAVLLICAILEDDQLENYINLSESLNLDQLVEVHDENELNRAIKAGAKIIGINNRNLRDFTVDLETTKRVSQKIPEDIILVSESGIKTREDVKYLQNFGADALLIGEQLMRSGNIEEELGKLKGINYES